MKAARFYGPGRYVVEDIPAPRCGAGDILLRVLANAVCGTDVKAYRAGHSLIRNYPVTTGHEFVGEVLESVADRFITISDSIGHYMISKP